MTANANLVFIAAMILLGAKAASAAGPDTIINFREYSASLASSGQPTGSQFPALREAGFERVIFLAFTDHEESVPWLFTRGRHCSQCSAEDFSNGA